MRASQLNIVTYRNDPADAEVTSHKLMARAGYIHKISAGLYVYGPMLLRTLRKISEIVRQELDAWEGRADLWQYFAVLLHVRSVGVMGDARTYEQTAAVRVVKSVDGITADWAELPHAVLARISTRIINEVRGINRVVYDITSKPPGTIELE